MILLINSNNIVHRTIKTKPIDVTDDYYAEYNENPNKKDPKFKVGKFLLLVKLKIQFLGHT